MSERLDFTDLGNDADLDHALEELNTWIPEPDVQVEEANEEVAERRMRAIGMDEVVYKVSVDFGGLGAWSIFVTRANLSTLISQVQLSKALGTVGLGNKLSKRASNLNLAAQLNRGESTRFRMGSGHSNGSARRMQLFRQLSERTPPPRRHTSRSEDAKKKNILFGITKLLFVPAVGSAARVRKVKEQRRSIVQSLFNTLLSDEKVRNSDTVKEFLCISNLTFDARFGKSFKEGWLKVTVQHRISDNEKLQWKGKCSFGCCVCACAPDPGRCSNTCQPQYRKNRRMWAVVKSSFVAFFENRPGKADVRRAAVVVCFSHFFEIFKGYGSTGSHRTITLVEDAKTVRLKFPHRWVKKIWSSALVAAFQSSNAEATLQVPGGWSANHENGSFAPRRFHTNKVDSEVCRAQWHVDGETYFAAVYEAIEAAESQIFIQGWWVSADLPLLRPSRAGDRSTTILGAIERKAKAGVQICVLMYNNVTVALPLDSQFQERQIESLAKFGEVHVLRHPEHHLKVNSTWFWSHHEKLVVIDQCHAFCGGIDLSWGRFDNHKHGLYDPHMHDASRIWPGIDFSNVRVKDFENVADFDRNQHPADCPRMPWHDAHCEWRGAIGRDIARHFIHQWNFARFSMSMERKVPALIPMDKLCFDYLVPGPESEADEDGNGHPFELVENLPQADDSDGPSRAGAASPDAVALNKLASTGSSESDEKAAGNGEDETGSSTIAQKANTNGAAATGSPDAAQAGPDHADQVDDSGDLEAGEESDATLWTDDEVDQEDLDRVNPKASTVLESAKNPEQTLLPAVEPGAPSDSLKEVSAHVVGAEGRPIDQDDAKVTAHNVLDQGVLPETLEARGPAQVEAKEEADGEEADLPPQDAGAPSETGRSASASGSSSSAQADHDTLSALDKRASEQDRSDQAEHSAGGAQVNPSKWGYPVHAQVVRSLGLWSGAPPGEKETSMERAMRGLIESARNFVYIENQFFISGMESDNLVANRVLESLYKRILRAHQAKQPFKVFVVVPALPGFEGFVSESPSIRRVLYFQYRCISRGPNSLFYHLLEAGVDPDEYICFFALRTWAGTPDNGKAHALLGTRKIATELIYVHSKVLIVDDEVCMIGSGNINDRSLTGNRDTEVSVVVRNAGDTPSEPPASPSQAWKLHPATEQREASFAKSMRLHLFREHWGNSPDLRRAIAAPWTAENFRRLRAAASHNTGIYEKHFNIVPRNDIQTAADLKAASVDRYTTIPYSSDVEKALRKIQGHIVILPLNFLCQWDLRPSILEDTSGAVLGDELFI